MPKEKRKREVSFWKHVKQLQKFSKKKMKSTFHLKNIMLRGHNFKQYITQGLPVDLLKSKWSPIHIFFNLELQCSIIFKISKEVYPDYLSHFYLENLETEVEVAWIFSTNELSSFQTYLCRGLLHIHVPNTVPNVPQRGFFCSRIIM